MNGYIATILYGVFGMAAVLIAAIWSAVYLQRHLVEPETPAEEDFREAVLPPPGIMESLAVAVTPDPPSRQTRRRQLWRRICARLRKKYPQMSRRELRDIARYYVYREL